MAEPWPVERFSASCWRVLHDSAHHDSIDFWHEEHARRYAALPVLIETIRAGCRGRRDPDTGDSLWCLFCECEIASGDACEHAPDCEGIAALKAAGEEP